MEITNLNIINFANNFGLLDNLTGFDFILTLNRNHNLIVAEATALAKTIEPSKAYSEFQKKGEALYRKYSQKDDSGGAKTIPLGTGGQSQFVLEEATKADFTADYTALRKEYQQAISAFTENSQQYREALSKSARPLKLKKFSKNDLPQELTSGQLKLLFSVGMVK